MELKQLFQLSIREFSDRLRKVPDEAWLETTRCCPDWTVRDLVNHVVGEFRWIPLLIAGTTIEEVGDSLEGDLLGEDPIEAWLHAGADALEAVPDGDVLERTVHLSTGPAKAGDYLAEVLSDQIIHTWDLASSIGKDETLHPDLVDFAKHTLEPLAASWREAGVLGEPIEVDEEADDQTKLLALLGRRARPGGSGRGR